MNPTISEILSIVAIAISVVTLVITLYLQYLRKPKIIGLAGDTMHLMYGPKREIFEFTLNISIFNKGAQSTAIVRIEGVIDSAGWRESTDFEWSAFAESKNIGKDGVYKPFMEFTGYPSPIVISGYSALTKTIHFSTKDKYILRAGKYNMRLRFYEGTAYTLCHEITMDVLLNIDSARYLHDVCVSDDSNVAHETLMLRRRSHTGEAFGSVV